MRKKFIELLKKPSNSLRDKRFFEWRTVALVHPLWKCPLALSRHRRISHPNAATHRLNRRGGSPHHGNQFFIIKCKSGKQHRDTAEFRQPGRRRVCAQSGSGRCLWFNQWGNMLLRTGWREAVRLLRSVGRQKWETLMTHTESDIQTVFSCLICLLTREALCHAFATLFWSCIFLSMQQNHSSKTSLTSKVVCLASEWAPNARECYPSLRGQI